MKKFLFLIFLLFIVAEKANACSCAGTQTPCEAYWKASAVFLGTVTYNSTDTSKQGEYEFHNRVFRFTVDKAFRGVEAKEVEVLTGSGGGDCGYGFQLGGQYLVYAHRDNTNKLFTSICSRTRPALDADADLAYFRDLPKLQPGGVPEKSAATIITISEGQHFAANDLILPRRLVERQLSGIVLDSSSGQPVRGATVWLKEIQYKDSDMPYRRETDQDGRFVFPVFEGVRYRLNAYLDRKEGPRPESGELQVVISPNPETIKLVLR